jgi:Coatomer epsilon subunit
MDLYHVKQQFVLGAYGRVTQVTLPDPSLRDYIPTLIYKTRAYIALNDPASALAIIPADSDHVAVKAVSALARYVAASDAATETKESTLEEMRDLCVEIEDAEGNEWEVGMVRVLAGTAFVRAGEMEEALETLGASTGTEHLEACVRQFSSTFYLMPLQRCYHRPNLPLHPPLRPREERIRARKALCGGRPFAAAHRVVDRARYRKGRVRELYVVLYRTNWEPVLVECAFVDGERRDEVVERGSDGGEE